MFSKTELLNNQLNAILRGQLIPDAKLSNKFKRRRFNRAHKALLTKNLFIQIRVTPGVQSFNDVATGYSLPMEDDVVIYSWTWANEDTVATNLGINRQIKLGIDGRDFINDVAAGANVLGHSQFTVFGPLASGFGTCALPCPIRVPKGRRVIAQLSWNPQPVFGASPQIPSVADTIILFCFAVKSCLDDDDQVTLDQVRHWIDNHEYQERVLLNSVTPDGFINPQPYVNAYPSYNLVGRIGSRMFTMSQSRTISAPLMVQAIATNLTFSEITIKDTRGHVFTPTGWVNARNFSALQNNFVGNVYFKLAMPHVLASGAQIVCEHLTAYERHPVNPGGPGEFSAVDMKWLTWAAVTP